MRCDAMRGWTDGVSTGWVWMEETLQDPKLPGAQRGEERVGCRRWRMGEMGEMGEMDGVRGSPREAGEEESRGF